MLGTGSVPSFFSFFFYRNTFRNQNASERPEFTQIYEETERLRAIPETPSTDLRVADNGFSSSSSSSKNYSEFNPGDTFILSNSPEYRLMEAFGSKVFSSFCNFTD